MILFPHTRDVLVQLLRKDGIGCEVGVAEGQFSRTLVKETSPKKLHLVDPWVHQDDEEYIADPNNVSTQEGEKRFREVSNAFSEECATGQVLIHRAFSTDAARNFPDHYFDWVYIDARHDYNSVLEDLAAFLPKLKLDGLLLGHDYANHSLATSMGFGVVEAVDDFCMSNNLNFITLTCETFPTYALSRKLETRAVQNIEQNIHFHFPHVVEFPDYPKNHQFELEVSKIKDSFKPVLKFRTRG